jgi:hypothetical protein
LTVNVDVVRPGPTGSSLTLVRLTVIAGVALSLIAGMTLARGMAPLAGPFESPKGCPPERTGTDGHDHFVGTLADDTYLALDGDDHARGRAGRDCLEGNEGDDVLRGGVGAERRVAQMTRLALVDVDVVAEIASAQLRLI